jgi:hypothetical protein
MWNTDGGRSKSPWGRHCECSEAIHTFFKLCSAHRITSCFVPCGRNDGFVDFSDTLYLHSILFIILLYILLLPEWGSLISGRLFFRK